MKGGGRNVAVARAERSRLGLAELSRKIGSAGMPSRIQKGTRNGADLDIGGHQGLAARPCQVGVERVRQADGRESCCDGYSPHSSARRPDRHRGINRSTGDHFTGQFYRFRQYSADLHSRRHKYLNNASRTVRRSNPAEKPAQVTMV